MGSAESHHDPEKWDPDLYERSFGFVSAYGNEVLDLLDPQPGERILDLGCGTGELAARIADSGAVVEGLDADMEMIAAARRRRPDLSFRRADGHDFSVEQPVDAVFSNAALHWMLDPDRVIGCVWKALRPGGRFVGEMGAAGNVQTIIDAVAGARETLGLPREMELPWFFPSVDTYATLLESRGFTVTRAAHIDRPTPLESCPNGLADWLEMFGAALLSGLSGTQRDAVVDLATERSREALCHDEVWYADYKRLRFVALRPA